MSAVRAWGQTLLLSWQPRLEFYDRRVDLLRRLGSVGEMSAFRWQDQVVGVQLDRSATVECGPPASR